MDVRMNDYSFLIQGIIILYFFLLNNICFAEACLLLGNVSHVSEVAHRPLILIIMLSDGYTGCLICIMLYLP